MNSNEPQSAGDRIRDKIERGNVRMRSRAFFAIQVAGSVLLALAAVLLSIFIGTLVFFTLRVNGHDSLLRLGFHGYALFLQVFPWWLLAIDVLLIVLLERLIRQFRFWYRRPVLYLFIGFAALAIFAGFGLDQGTPINDQLLHRADEGGLPAPLGPLYQQSRRPPPAGSGIYRGTVISVSTSTLLLSDSDSDADDPLTIVLPQSGPGAHEHFSVGDTVLVVGDATAGNIVHAIDIDHFDPDGLPPRR